MKAQAQAQALGNRQDLLRSTLTLRCDIPANKILGELVQQNNLPRIKLL